VHNILLYEPCLEKIAHFKFLLDLSHIACIFVHSVDELINRLALDHKIGDKHELIVLNSIAGLDRSGVLNKVAYFANSPIICMVPSVVRIPPKEQSAVKFCPSHLFLTCIHAHLDQSGSK